MITRFEVLKHLGTLKNQKVINLYRKSALNEIMVLRLLNLCGGCLLYFVFECRLFNDAVFKPDYIALNDWIVMNNGLERKHF